MAEQLLEPKVSHPHQARHHQRKFVHVRKNVVGTMKHERDQQQRFAQAQRDPGCDVPLDGRTAAGEAAVFSGTLVIAKGPGAPPELTQRNIRGAVLTGDLKIGTQPWQPYSQPYTR